MNSSVFPRWPGRAASVLAAVLLASFAALPAPAQTVINSTSGPPPPPPPRPVETQSRGPSLGPEWSRPPPQMQDTYGSYDSKVIGKPVLGPFFIPILLPVLGALPSSEPLATNYPRDAAGEPFLMAYGNLAAKHELSAKRAERIAIYRAARLTLLTELRAELNRGPEVAAAVRERTLADLSAAQTPRLLELEAEAEKIRYDLTRVELFSTAADDIGKLVPGRENPDFATALTAMRRLLSAAHFREGFSPDQRRLLEEMAQEQRLTIESSHGTGVFFWPAGARIPAPRGLDAGTAEKFAEFQRRKAMLKADLRAMLDQEQGRVFNFDPTDDFAQLAAAQAPRFAELDALADELRPALGALAAANDGPNAQLPAELSRQVAAIVNRRATLQRELYARLTEFRRALPAERVELVRKDSGMAIAITTDKGSQAARDEVLVGINAFNAEISARFEALVDERDVVRAALARYLANLGGSAKAGITVDQLATDFLAAYNGREQRNRQRDYRAALFSPGLSPAQRRLLFAGAAADLLPERPLTSP